MSRRRKWWLIGIGGALLASVAVLYLAAAIMARRFEPLVRQQAIEYLSSRFHSDVQIAALHLRVPKLSWFKLLRYRGRGTRVDVEGQGLAMHLAGSGGLPPLFSVRTLRFVADLGSLTSGLRTVDAVWLDGVEINVPPKVELPASHSQPAPPQGAPAPPPVLIQAIHVHDAALVILPKTQDRKPLRFQIARIELASVSPGAPMKYDATLAIPTPPGQVHSAGTFGPWDAGDPGGTPLAGQYTFDQADLGVFNGIAGILHSTGSFEGTLSSIRARGQAYVPDFRLKMTGTPVPLATSFEVLVDGTNGNTVLEPVQALLGKTAFTTTGAVVKRERHERRSIDLNVAMPNGDLRDLLRLTMKGPPFMEGRVTLRTRISIPPLKGKVKDKLALDGDFQIHDARFLRSTIQSQIDSLSRHGQGQPENQAIDSVVSDMAGSFRLAAGVMTFRSLSFGVPGAHVQLAGDYDMNHDNLDLHGNLKLTAKVSELVTGWKSWVLKPIDPLFERHGAGTFLPIKVQGSSHQPKFGLDFHTTAAAVN
jgi:AsmA-like C-terminal region